MLSVLVKLPPLVKKGILLAFDAVLIPVSLWLALSLRLNAVFHEPDGLWQVCMVLVLLSLPMFTRLGLYRTVVRHLAERGLWLMARAAAFSALIMGAITYLNEAVFLPRSVFVIYGLVLFALLALSRAAAGILLGGRRAFVRGQPVAIYGAGESGRQLASNLRMGMEYLPVVFLDREMDLQGRSIDTLNVLNPYRDDLVQILHGLGVSQILLAIPGLARSQRRSILERLEKLAFHVRTVPSMEDILSGKARLDQLEEISIEDLLGRDQVPPLPGLLGRCIAGRSVLVTGAGGSIGSELCRQVLQQGAGRLVLLDHSEFALYQVEMELRQVCERDGLGTEIVAVLGSVQDRALVNRLFDAVLPDTVYHAAAYKHVPIVEENPFEGIRNNVFGTQVVAEAALRKGIGHFILISTDKAVRPTNVMGASKRMAELVVQAMSLMSKGTVFSMVRFGNVLGSSGSVVPLFRKQIAVGGPVTLTHLDVTRFFMSIPEAVQLVIQAGAMAKGGEVFVLDMGEPVRIAELAERMIHLSGRRVKTAENPDGDIEIHVSGLRPGEKLYEELLIGDAVGGTEHPRVMRAEEECFAWPVLGKAIDELDELVVSNDSNALKRFLQTWVTGYKPNLVVDDDSEEVVEEAEDIVLTLG